VCKFGMEIRQRIKFHVPIPRTVFPRCAAATNFFARLKLAVTIRGRRLLEGGDKNVHSSITAYMDTEKVYSKYNT
jgi:hypothetical protein